jgi:UDP-2,3-diacylglucosamine pyrophosphatase LpxH
MIIGFFALTIWSAITGYFAISSIPGIVAHFQGKVYKNSNPKDKTAEQVINDEYYQESKDTIDADVVVFGHNHFASSYPCNTKTGKKLFLNSGSWVKEDEEIDGKMRYSNTFIY